MNQYIGHETQIYGIEEHRLVGGKGDGMRLLEIHNGKGIDLTVSLDRAADISRLRFKGDNFSYFSPCGYVAPSFYQQEGTGWLQSFTAGFLTTCGLRAVGTPCVDDGEKLPLHGSIANTPANTAYWKQEGNELVVYATVSDEAIFGSKLKMERQIRASVIENTFCIKDKISNTGDKREPFEILYHMNMGFPLLDEESVVQIPSDKIFPRNEHAAEDLDNCKQMEKPQSGYEERCYYHQFSKREGIASIFQPKIGKGLKIEFDTEQLDGFVEWKMMGVRDYVLGLECGNCYPDGRDVMRANGMLKYIDPGDCKEYEVKITMLEK